MYLILSLFVLNSFLDWNPWDRGGCVTASGRGANHRICDTRWTESATCDIIWSWPTPFECWLSCHNLVALNHCKQRLNVRTVLFHEFIGAWYITESYKELLPFPSIFKIIPFFFFYFCVALAGILCIKYMSEYHELLKSKKYAHALGISCYLVNDFIVYNTWVCQIYLMNLNSSPCFYVAMSGKVRCSCYIGCQGQKRKWRLNTGDSKLRWNHEMNCFGCDNSE